MSRGGQILLALALIGLSIALFLLAYERRSEEEWRRPAPEAMQQVWLAAERLLQAEGVQVAHIDALEQSAEHGAGTVLLLPAGRGLVTDRALASVDRYLQRGGHLVVESEAWSNDDPLFDHLGIEREEAPRPDYNEYYDSGDWMDRYKRPLQPLSPVNPDLLRLQWQPGGPELVVASRGGELLAATDSLRLISGTDGVRMLQLDRGDGLVTAVNDLSFGQNWRIGRHDNAEFLWQLVNDRPDLGQVLFYRVRSETLGAWLKRNAWMPLAALALLGLFALWHSAPRFGPMAADPEPARRRLGDHLLASGRFLWSHGERQRLLHSALRHARAELYRHAPHLRLLPPQTQISWLLERHRLSPTQAQAIIAGHASSSEVTAFLNLLRGCRFLHQGLQPRLAKSEADQPDGEST